MNWEDQDKEIEELERQLAEEERDLVSALNQAGVAVDSVWDLVNTSSDYSAAIPILVSAIGQPYSERLKEGIVRALTVTEARGFTEPHLINELGQLDFSKYSEQYVFVVLNALSQLGSLAVLNDLEEFLSGIDDKRFLEIAVVALKDSPRTEYKHLADRIESGDIKVA